MMKALLLVAIALADAKRSKHKHTTTSPQARAALCVSGQLRTFAEAHASLAGLRASFPGGADVFLFVSRSKDDLKATQLDAARGGV